MTQEETKNRVIELYESGFNCIQIKNEMGFKYHQPILNILKHYEGYIPYRNGRGCKRKYSINETYFSKIDTEEKAYIMGFISADGNIDIVWNRLKFVIQTIDAELLEKIRISLSSDAPLKRFVRQSSFLYGKREFHHSSIEFNSKTLIHDLLSYGLTHNKTYTLNSSIIAKIPEEFIRHFVRGYFDGDGSVIFGKKYSSGRKYLIQIAGNKEFLENVIMKYFPTNCKLYYYKKSRQTFCYKISSKEQVSKFLRWIYEGSKIHLERKYRIYLKYAHLKPIELLETPTLKVRAISSEASKEERSETIETTY